MPDIAKHPRSLEVCDPHKLERLVARLGKGESMRSIMEAESCDYGTLVRLKEAYPQKIEEWRKVAASKTQAFVDALMDEALRRAENGELREASLKELMVGAGIAVDKSLSLAGEASTIVEHRSGLDVNEARKALEQAQKRIQGEAIDI